MEHKKENIQIDGNNNITIKNIDGSSLQLSVNDTEQIIVLLEKWEKKRASANRDQKILLKRNIALLEKFSNDFFQALGREEFREDIARLTSRFIGRSEEIREIKDYIEATKEGMFFIFGSPGIGKSSLSAKVIDELQSEQLSLTEETIKVIPYFIRRGTESAQVNSLLSYLNRQVEDLLKTDLSIEKNTNDLRAGLHQRLKKAADYLYNKKIVLFIDGLDEGTDTNLLNHLLRNTYPNVLIVYSGRYTDEVENLYFQSRNLANFKELRLKGLPDKVVGDIIQKFTKKYFISETLNTQIISNSQGNPKYLELLELSLEKGIIQLSSNSDVPKFTEDFDNFYAPLIKSYTQHEFGNFILSCLYALSVAKDYLNTLQLRNILNLDQGDIGKAIFVLNEVLITITDSRNNKHYQLFHESLRDYLNHKEYYPLLESKYKITDYCQGWKTQRLNILKEYPAKYYPDHLFDLIHEEQDKQCKEELFGLAEDKAFVDLQIELTEQFYSSFDLYEKSIRVAVSDKSHEKAIQLSLRTVELYQRQEGGLGKIIQWSKSGQMEEIKKALSMLEAIPTEKKVKAYAVLLHHNLIGVNKGSRGQKEVCQKIVDHLDENLEKVSTVFKLFRYWYIIYRECKRIGINIPFLHKRIDFTLATEPNPNHENRWSYFQEFIYHADLSNDFELDFILEFFQLIPGADRTDSFGYGFSLFKNNLIFTARRLKETGALERIQRLEEITLHQIKKLGQIRSGAARIVSLGQAKSILVEIALLQDDETKAYAHWEAIHDTRPSVNMGLKVAKRYFELGNVEVGDRMIKKIINRGSRLLGDKTDGLKFLGQLAEFTDEIPSLNANTIHFLRKAFDMLQSSRIRGRELKAISKPLLKLRNLPAEDFEYFIGFVLQSKGLRYDFDGLEPKFIARLFENGGVQSLKSVSSNYRAVEFLDLLFPLYEQLVVDEKYTKTEDLLTYLRQQLDRLKEEFPSNIASGQEFRLKFKVGAINLSFDPAGMDLVQEALDIQDQNYVDNYIVMTTYVYAFPFVYQYGDKEIGAQLMKHAIESAVGELKSSELNLSKVIKGLVKIKKQKEALSLFQLMIDSTETDLYSKGLIEHFIKAGYEDQLSELRLNEDVLKALSYFVHDENKEQVYQMINNFHEVDLLQPEPIKILDKTDIEHAYYSGVLNYGGNESDMRKAKVRLKEEESLIRKKALKYLENENEQVLEMTESLGKGYRYIVYNAEDGEWEGVVVQDYYSNELKEKTSELGLYGDLALSLYKERGLDIVKAIPALATDPSETERIARLIALALLKDRKYIEAKDWILKELGGCDNVYFWQDVILGFSEDEQGINSAEAFLKNLEKCKDSNLAPKVLESYLDFVSKLILQQEFEKVSPYLDKIRALEKESEQARKKAESICGLVSHISLHKIPINSRDDLEAVLLSLSPGEERLLYELRNYAPWFLFYLGKYDEALSMAERIEDDFFKDFYVLVPMANQLIWRGALETAISFALQIEDDNNKVLPFEMAIEKLAEQGKISKAIRMLKKYPEFESEKVQIERIIDACQEKDLPIVKEFIFKELSKAPGEVRYTLWRYFLIKVAMFPHTIHNWIDQTLVNNLQNLDNLITILYLEHLVLPKTGVDSIGSEIRTLLDIGVEN